MATTKIWDVKGWLGKVVIYIENPEKTENPAFYQKEGLTETQAQGLSDVIEYTINSDKTEKQFYVSAVNCSTLTARDEMMAVKKRYGKEDGIVAFHGYQSFAEGEVTPDMAHEIGVRLAEELRKEIAGLSKEIRKLREEVVLCDRIAERSQSMKEKLQVVQKERQQGKEEKNYEHRRRSSRTSGTDETEGS